MLAHGPRTLRKVNRTIHMCRHDDEYQNGSLYASLLERYGRKGDYWQGRLLTQASARCSSSAAVILRSSEGCGSETTQIDAIEEFTGKT